MTDGSSHARGDYTGLHPMVVDFMAVSLDLQNQGAASDVQRRAPGLARFFFDWPRQNSHDHSIGRQSAVRRPELALHALVTWPYRVGGTHGL